ncbi:MAG: hypothetical protein KA368_10040 [Acidobacteria bacterium]|nr:hypothetical protein [Acidobacteriota bacterium]
MERTGFLEIRVIGKKGNLELTPKNYDIKDVIAVLEQAESLLFPNNKKERPVISYDIQEGSVKHVLTTALQVIIGFNAVLAEIKQSNYSIDFLESQTAKTFFAFREIAQKQDVAFEISTSLENSSHIVIDKNTEFIRSEEMWVDAEFYFYGLVIDAGGKQQANVHLDTKEYGVLKIDADKKLLENYESNPLYKNYGIRAKGKQNTSTGEIDKGSLKLIQIIDYSPAFKEDYINGLISKAQKSWAGVADADEWLSNLRRGYGR